MGACQEIVLADKEEQFIRIFLEVLNISNKTMFIIVLYRDKYLESSCVLINRNSYCYYYDDKKYFKNQDWRVMTLGTEIHNKDQI